MRIVQSIGFNVTTGWPTPFYYRRDKDGVHIRSAIGEQDVEIDLSHAEWGAILETVASQPSNLFGVTGELLSNFRGPKLYDLIGNVVDYSRNDRAKAYISAVLVHEGTLHPYHGQVPGGLEARVYLKRSGPDRRTTN